MTIDRRTLLLAPALVALCPLRALAETAADDFRIDWQGGPQSPDVLQSLTAQIAIVRSLKIRADIAAFFAAQPIMVDREADTLTRAGPRGVFFERRALPADNPVLLHELLHRYHALRLPQGEGNPDLLRFFRMAHGTSFPPEAYMFTNVREFFAMTASVALWGKAARPPRTRENLRQRLPELYAWIVREFGLSV